MMQGNNIFELNASIFTVLVVDSLLLYIYVTPVGVPCKPNLKIASKIALAPPRRLRMAAAVAGDLFYF